jgi:hypothetical protein
MPTPFADLEARVNASVFRHMTNATASFTPAGGGDSVDDVEVVFDAARAMEDELGVVSLRPVLQLPPGAVPGLATGYTADLVGAFGTGSYKVRQVLPIAEGGWQTVVLAGA